MSTSDFGSRNVVRDLRVSRISWDKLGCGFSRYLWSIVRVSQGLGYEKNEHLC